MRLLFVLCGIFALCSYVKAQAPPRFVNYCRDVHSNEKSFDGQCNLLESVVYQNILTVFNTLLEADPTLTLDTFFRGFTVNTTFFRNEYKDKADYIKSLDDLGTLLKPLLDVFKAKQALSNTKMLDAWAPFQISNFSGVSRQIISDVDATIKAEIQQLIIDSPEGNVSNNSQTDIITLTVRQKYQCTYDPIFCPTTSSYIGRNYSNNLNVLGNATVSEFLKTFNNNVFLVTGSKIFYRGPKADFDNFVDKLDEEGTTSILMRDFQKVLNTSYAREALYQYNNVRTTVIYTRPIITTQAPRTTTPKQKVIDVEAVSSTLYLSIPLAAMALGIVGTLAVAFGVYRCKAVKHHAVAAVRQQAEVQVVNSLERQQDVEMNPLEGQNYIKF